ncbi:MAG: ExbD/TolR family protein [Bdellovibrionales bacterium]
MAAGGGNEPNLTPFIDLFSVLICFLLMTAAWIQLEVMPTNIEKATSSDVPTEAPPPDPNKINLFVDMAPQAITLRENDKALQVPHAATGIDSGRIIRVLEDWKARFPDRSDVILNTEADVRYGDLIRMYDILVSNNFADVGINPR